MFRSLFVNTPWQGEAMRFVSTNPSSINTAFSNLQGSGPVRLFLEDAESRILEMMMTGQMRPVTLLVSIPLYFLGNKVVNRSVQSLARCEVLCERLALKALLLLPKEKPRAAQMQKKSADTASAQSSLCLVWSLWCTSLRSGRILSTPSFKLQWFSLHTGVSSLNMTVPASFREGAIGRKHQAL